MQWLNYHHLYYFYVIASEGSVTAATLKLSLAQSTLSAQLKQFEDAIGQKLFERQRRRLILTDVGRRVFDYAHEIFSLGNELRQSIREQQLAPQGAISLGVMDSIPKSLTRKLFEEVVTNLGATISIAEESLGSLCARLEEHQIDLLLANDKPPTEGKMSRFHSKLIGDLPVIFVAPRTMSHLLDDMPRSLDRRPVIMPGENSPIYQEVREHFKIKHIQPHVIGQVDDLELQKQLVMDGHGFAPLPLLAVEEELSRGELVRLSDTPICHENLWFVAAHRIIHNPVAQKLLQSFRPTQNPRI